jgi:hypothetical protein
VSTYYTLTGTYQYGDGSARTGKLHFAPTTTVVGDTVIILPTPVTVTLGAGGAFSVKLAATNDPSWTPSGWLWTVTEMLDDGRAPWSFEMLADADISDLATVVPQGSSTTLVPTTRNVIAGAGLTGGGDLSADRTFSVGAGTGITVSADSVSVVYGSTASTAAQGNDLRLSAIINVKSYGATGDGTTDDTAAIQAALDAVPAVGGTVHLPAGTYSVPSGGLTCAKPLTILGDGAGTYESGGSRIVCASATATLLTLSSPGAVVSGVALINSSGTRPTAGAGLLLTDFDYGRIERVLVDGFWNNVQVDSGYYFSLRDSAILNPRNYGVYLRNTTSLQFDHGDHVIEGCVIAKYGDTTAGGTAVRWESGGGLRFIGNKINANTQPGYTSTARLARGVDVYMAGASTSVFTATGNSIENFSEYGIQCAGGPSGGFGKIAINGNEFLGYSTAPSIAIAVDGTGMASLIKGVTISGNVMYNGIGCSLKFIDGITVTGNEMAYLTSTAIALTSITRLHIAANAMTTALIDNDANSSAAGTYHDRPFALRQSRDLAGSTTNVQCGRIMPGTYTSSVIKVRVMANVNTVGGCLLEQTRQVTRGAGDPVVGATVGTDLNFGASITELSLAWTVNAGFLKPTVTSVNGKAMAGHIDVEVLGGHMYQFRLDN